MTAKEYLQQVRLLDAKIEKSIEDLERLESMATRVTAALAGESVLKTRNADAMTDSVAKIVALQDAINRDVEKYTEVKENILKQLSKLDDPICYQILYRRYILYQKWEQIACDMSYSFRGVTKIHGKALRAFAQWIKE